MDSELHLCRLAVEQGLADPRQIQECLKIQARMSASGAATRISDILVQKGYLTAAQIDQLLRLSGSITLPMAPPAALPEGERVGKYVKSMKIGAGGMGEVWKAWDTELNRWIAIKFLKSRDPDEAARFQREAQTSAKLSHPHIAAVYEATENYIAMQLIDGPTLERFPRDDPRALAEIIRQAALAAHFAHDHGIVHRDMKPANIMVVKNHAYVMDFGLARPMDVPSTVSVSGTTVGTPYYMSPEQAQANPDLDARTDVYSLGATLYELLTDRPPFWDRNPYELIKKVVEEEPRPVRALNTRIDPDLETIVMKCLRKDREHRYPTALALAEDLARWLAGEPIDAHAPSMTYRVRKHLAKRRGLLVGLAVAAAAIVVSAVFWATLRRETEKKIHEADVKRREDEIFEPIRERIKDLPETREGRERGIQLLDEGLKKYESAWAWMRKGEYLEKLGRPTEALEAYAKAAAINPKLGTAHYRRGFILMHVLHKNDEARIEFETAESVEPGNEYAAVGRASIAVLKKEYAKALEICDAAEPIGKHVAELYFVRGFVRALLESTVFDPERAVKDFTRAIELQPNLVLAWHSRGATLYSLGRLDEALKDLTKALEMDPSLGDGWFNLGAVRKARGEYAKAIQAFTRAIELNPRSVAAWTIRSMCKVAAGDVTGAIDDCSEAIRIDPKSAEAYLLRGDALRAGGNPEAAIEDYGRAIEHNPRMVEAWNNRGNAYQNTGEYERAIRDHTKAIDLRPAMPEAYAARAEAQELLAKNTPARARELLERAERDLMKALEVAPRDWRFRDAAEQYLTRIRTKLGK